MIWMSYLNHKNVFGIGMPSTWQDVFFRGRPGPRKKARGFTDFFVILLAFYLFAIMDMGLNAIAMRLEVVSGNVTVSPVCS